MLHIAAKCYTVIVGGECENTYFLGKKNFSALARYMHYI
jgi:hypothetical protein